MLLINLLQVTAVIWKHGKVAKGSVALQGLQLVFHFGGRSSQCSFQQELAKIEI